MMTLTVMVEDEHEEYRWRVWVVQLGFIHGIQSIYKIDLVMENNVRKRKRL